LHLPCCPKKQIGVHRCYSKVACIRNPVESGADGLNHALKCFELAGLAVALMPQGTKSKSIAEHPKVAFMLFPVKSGEDDPNTPLSALS
jgi:hypothetical protein